MKPLPKSTTSLIAALAIVLAPTATPAATASTTAWHHTDGFDWFMESLWNTWQRFVQHGWADYPHNPGSPSNITVTPWTKPVKTANYDGLRRSFERVSTYPVFNNLPHGIDPTDETVAEISAVSADGKTVAYTDAAGKRIGFVDISNPKNPRGVGSVDLTHNGHANDEPTSVSIVGDYVLVVVNTSESFTSTSGRVDVIRLSDRTTVRSLDLAGQPDSIAVNSDGTKAVIAIENERDEDFTPTGGDEGDLPQAPAGFVTLLDMPNSQVSSWSTTDVKLVDDGGYPIKIVADAGIDTPTDPEPEYVAINSQNIAAVTLQENNGVVLIDLATATVTQAFSLGNATVSNIDANKDGAFKATDSLTVPREPDAIAWIDVNHFATANEGDWKGGSRGWTVFNTAGDVVWDAGNSFEQLATRYGLHNEKRAAKKGAEPEGIAVARYGRHTYAFIGSERSNFVAIYEVSDPAKPKFVQVIPTGVGPEGLLPVPSRNLLVVSSEVDEADAGVRSTVGVYRLQRKEADLWPSLVSADNDKGLAIGWSALSGLSNVPGESNRVVAVGDKAFNTGRIYDITITPGKPATITGVVEVRDENGPATVDLEGISTRADGGYWLASEGNGADNVLLQVDNSGLIKQRVSLPDEVASHVGKWGLEGVSVVGSGDDEAVYFVIQRPLWNDPKDTGAGQVDGDNVARIGRYDVSSGEFSWFGYQLESTAVDGDWVGLSEITMLSDTTALVIERDKQVGTAAAHKKIYQVTLPESGCATDDCANLPMATKKVAIDALPVLQSTHGWTQEKLEGLTVTADGTVWGVTDNDGLDDATGETVFTQLGVVDGDVTRLLSHGSS